MDTIENAETHLEELIKLKKDYKKRSKEFDSAIMMKIDDIDYYVTEMLSDCKNALKENKAVYERRTEFKSVISRI